MRLNDKEQPLTKLLINGEKLKKGQRRLCKYCCCETKELSDTEKVVSELDKKLESLREQNKLGENGQQQKNQSLL